MQSKKIINVSKKLSKQLVSTKKIANTYSPGWTYVKLFFINRKREYIKKTWQKLFKNVHKGNQNYNQKQEKTYILDEILIPKEKNLNQKLMLLVNLKICSYTNQTKSCMEVSLTAQLWWDQSWDQNCPIYTD